MVGALKALVLAALCGAAALVLIAVRPREPPDLLLGGALLLASHHPCQLGPHSAAFFMTAIRR